MRLQLIAVVAMLCSTQVRAADEVDYLRDVKPLLASRCFSCHSALRQKSDLRLDTADFIRKGGELGPAIVPGESEESALIHAVTGSEGMTRMPPDGDGAALEPGQVELLKRWIDQGARAPADDKPLDDPRRHWSFIPPVRPKLPELKQPADVRNPIDLLLAAEHQRLGLQPLGPARKDTLLRRVYLDLIGLPPNRAELHDFLADAGDDAYERVVDRLLASPQYGERWGRHWMDVWRYSDWYGRRRENDVRNSYPHIWRWRDWIVESLNADKGYDRMVMEMLAGDELAPEDDSTIVATGFIVRNWYSMNYDQWMRDLVEHTGKAFLGLRLNCALCHDHKYDPITQEEQFRFRAFFEPLELRHDRVPGGPPLGKYLRYVPSGSGNLPPIEAGLARIYEEYPGAPTYMYRGGDARMKIEGRPPVTPGTPAALGGTLPAIENIKLSPEAWYPGLKPWLQREELSRCETAILNEAAAIESAKQDRNVKSLGLREQLVSAENTFNEWLPHAGEAAEQFQSAETQLLAARDQLELLDLAVLEAEANYARAVAERESSSLRIAADQIKFKRAEGDLDGIIPKVKQAARELAAAQAREAVAKAEKNAVAARVSAAADAKLQSSVAKAETVLAAAKAALKKTLATEPPATADYPTLTPTYRPTSTGRRRALAAWIVGRDNPLTARVAVNHLWLRHFGRPLVANVYDFGRAGEPPTHPALLDWLAVELMDHNWSMKHLHRLLVTSDAYRRASDTKETSENMAIDRENRYWWRADVRRMEAEVVRDSLLSSAGVLDAKLGGKEVDNTLAMTSRRRGLYFTIYPEEGGSSPLTNLFDAPDPSECYRRTETHLPQQALALVNSSLAIEMSRLAAGRLSSEIASEASNVSADAQPRFVTMAFQQILTRDPTAAETIACLEFLKRQTALYPTSAPTIAASSSGPSSDPVQRARESLIRALYSHHDWITIH